MRVGASVAVMNYQAAYDGKQKTKSEAAKKSSGQDTITISEEGKKALEQGTGEKSYDLKKVMEIHKKGFSEIPTREESEYYWAARKSDPELDAQLYEADKADALAAMQRVQTIILKASLGQKLTAEEAKMVKDDPMLQQEIETRKAKMLQ